MSDWPTIEGKRLTQMDAHNLVVDRDRARRDLRDEKGKVAELEGEALLFGPIEHAEEAIRDAGGDPKQVGKDGASFVRALIAERKLRKLQAQLDRENASNDSLELKMGMLVEELAAATCGEDWDPATYVATQTPEEIRAAGHAWADERATIRELRDQLDSANGRMKELEGELQSEDQHGYKSEWSCAREEVGRLKAQLDRAKDEIIGWAEGVAAAEEEAAKAIAGTDGHWDCVCAPEPGAMHSQDCPAYLRQSVENIVTANQSLRDQLDRATSDGMMVWPIQDNGMRVSQANWDLVCGEVLNLEEEVRRVTEQTLSQPSPRSMESAPRGGDEVALVMRAMYVRGMGWVVDRETKPIGWLPTTSITTDKQVVE